MNNKLKLYPLESSESLEFDKILTILQSNCLSSLGINALKNNQFLSNVDELNFSLKQVAEMKSALMNGLHFPAQNYHDLTEELKALAITNNIVEGKQLRKVMQCAQTIGDIALFFKKHKDEFFTLRKNLELINIDKDIPLVIDKIIDETGNVRNNASPALLKIRKDINGKANAIHIVFGRILSSLKVENKLAETQESIRNGRRVLALQAESKRSINGIIHDESDSGKTTFIEPQETVLLNNELFELERDEKREIHKILLDLCKIINSKLSTLRNYQEILATYDFVRAKAILAVKLNASMPIIEEKTVLQYFNAYHPLLLLKNSSQGKATIPFDLMLTKQQSILLISGPNAGGKSVTLKTVGLFQLMLQFGLLLPCDENSKIGLFEQIFTDLGDKQSIEDELSTYSSHILLMKNFLQGANNKTLFLIDEFGTGTDPRFGAAMAEALMLHLVKTNAFGVITTHYSNLKKVAEQDERFLNAAMVFNENNLSPTYQLQTGKPGSSYTFAIAEKSGLNADLISLAKSLVDYSDLKFEDLISKVENERKQLETENRNIKKENLKLREATIKFELINAQIQNRQNELRKQLIDFEKQKNEIIEERVNLVLNDINNSKSKEIAAKKAKEFANLRNEVLYKKEQDLPLVKITSNQKIGVGDLVLIGNSENQGEIIELRGNTALVNFNGIKTNVDLKKLQKVEIEKQEQKQYKKAAIYQDVESTFDIRGLLQEECRPIIEQYFDQALYNNLETIKIIHGKGSGALRRQLQQLIKEYKSNILEWKYEEEKQGGNGATIITFK